MKAIQTRFIGPTNFRGARIKAYAEGGASVTVPYGYDSESRDHDLAALAFLRKFTWGGVWVGGGSADGRGNVYVCVRASKVGRIGKGQ